MSKREFKPAILVVHDDTIVGEATVEAMQKKRLAVRETSWSRLELSNALGIVSIPPTSGESRREIVERTRQVLDAAREQGARVVQCHHPGVLGWPDPRVPLSAESRALVDSVPYFHREYLREMEIYRYLEQGTHIVPVILGFSVSGDGASDWRIREGLREWRDYLHLEDREIDVSRPSSLGAGLVAALQQARPGRRYVFGGSSMSLRKLAEGLGVEMNGPISAARFSRGAETAGRFFEGATERLTSGLEPVIYGARLDSTRARGELGYMPLAATFG